jgi:pimeloyl-ACP methyl ester carboxylesterase
LRAVVPGDRRRRRALSRAAYVRALATDVTEVPVSFRVVNRNGSRVQCMADGQTYTVRGRLVGSRAAIDSGGAVTVYLHQIGLASDYWHFTAVPGYDYATELARAGHASLVYDQVGYGTSGKPDPATVCYGGEADIASQIAARLRKGDYGGPAFTKVALASHSVMGLASQPEAYSFTDVDALIVTSWADQGFSQRFRDASRDTEAYCAQNGGHADLPPDRFKEGYFADAEPAVVAAATALRAPIPCGEPQSAFQTIGADVASLHELTIPVLLVYGRKDALFDQPGAGENQARLFAGTPDLTTEFVDGAGHALALERTAPAYRRLMNAWLSARGF